MTMSRKSCVVSARRLKKLPEKATSHEKSRLASGPKTFNLRRIPQPTDANSVASPAQVSTKVTNARRSSRDQVPIWSRRSHHHFVHPLGSSVTDSGLAKRVSNARQISDLAYTHPSSNRRSWPTV